MGVVQVTGELANNFFEVRLLSFFRARAGPSIKIDIEIAVGDQCLQARVQDHRRLQVIGRPSVSLFLLVAALPVPVSRYLLIEQLIRIVLAALQLRDDDRALRFAVIRMV